MRTAAAPSLSAMSPSLTAPLGAVLDQAPASWRSVIQAWRHSGAGQGLVAAIEVRQNAGATIYPATPLRALEWTPRESVRVVILGQDPYHGPGQAEGMAFSVPDGIKPPPSLRNILLELGRDLGPHLSGRGHLEAWALQGVLLLNTALTVEEAQPGAHAKLGWAALTDALVAAVAADAGSKVFMLWGAHAQAKGPLIESVGGGRHRVLCANHPSPLSARRPPLPFLGCGHFGQTQAHLSSQPGRLSPIDWSV